MGTVLVVVVAVVMVLLRLRMGMGMVRVVGNSDMGMGSWCEWEALGHGMVEGVLFR